MSPITISPQFVLVGGFLGAGKTTLILKAAERLEAQGRRVAVITNDQDVELVDTLQARARGLPTSEVAGACFCCRFSDLLDAADQLAKYRPEIIFAEPVGSCTDLAATIVQPLLAFHREAYRVPPLSVLVDPAMAMRLRDGKLDDDTAFLMKNQIAEADLICLTKKDLYPEPPALPFPVDCHVSGRDGEGVADWLEEIFAGRRIAGARMLDLDYSRYAEAEAALGWLNLHAEIHLREAATPALVVGPLMDRLDERLTAADISIAHLKTFDRAATGWVRAGVTANGGEPQPEGDLLAEAAVDHQLAINLRALGDPDVLRSIAMRALEGFGDQVKILHLGAFRPARPTPEYRMGRA